jgi:DNA polymerase-3 subunit delta
MSGSDIKSKKRNCSIYVIAGKERSLVDMEYRELLDKLVEPAQRMVSLFDADADTVTISQVLDELRTLPFLADKRVVVIKGADDFVSANRQLLEKYFESPSPSGILILTVSSWSAQTKLAKLLSKVGELIPVEQPKPWQLPQRVCQYAKEAYGKEFEKGAAELLVELAGDELGRLYSEVDKLATFADKEKVITANHVELLIGHNRLFNAFAVIDAITSGEISKAVERLRSMFAEDRSTEYTVVGAFAFHFRRLFNAKVLLQKGLSCDQIAKKVRVWSNRDGFFAQVRKLSLKQIGRYLQKLAEIDHAIKTGQTKAQVAMEQLVLGLAAGSA